MRNHHKIWSILAALALAFLCLTAVPSLASADSLRSVQDHIMNTPAGKLLITKVELSGIIEKIEFVTGNHYNMFISVDEDNAYDTIYAPKPFFIGHFRFHDVYMPFEPGQEVTVAGEINYLYSSPLVPYIQIETINGSDEF